MAQNSRELFQIRGKNELDMYNVNKGLWTVFDQVSIQHFSPELEGVVQNLHGKTPDSLKMGGLCSSLVTMANEPHCQLIKLLF